MTDLLSNLIELGDEAESPMIKENLKNRILVVNDEIDDYCLTNYVLYILDWNRQDKDIPIEKRVPITLYINCVGGSVMDGNNFVDAIQTSQTPVRGVCFGLAASMAFHIYIACKERIAFKNSILLQHDGEVAIQNSSSKAKDTMKFFEKMDERAKQHVLSCTKMTEEFYDKIYEQEYYMYADEAKALGCVDKIIGEDCSINEIL